MLNLENFSNVRVLVIGDIMMDKYLWGEVTRISPEAPVPVVDLKKTSFRVGGAANVAANIAGLGAKVCLLGVKGVDSEGQMFEKILDDADVSSEYLLSSTERITTTKTRIIAHNQQIARLDQESAQKLSDKEEEYLWQSIEKNISSTDVIVISDYAKGVITETLSVRLITLAKTLGKIVLVDPKGRDYSKYKDATVITPNKFELAEACGCGSSEIEAITDAARNLIFQLHLEALIVTRGEEGVALIEKNGLVQTQKAAARTVFDVTGAGDTFISVLSTALGAGADLKKAMQIANLGAGLAVEEIGTTIISFEKLNKALNELSENSIF